MPYKDITPLLKIGEPLIDKEHAFLIKRLEYLVDELQPPPENELFFAILSEIGFEIGKHFAHEEVIIKTLRMPDAEVQRHLHAHNEIIEQFVQLNLDLMDGQSFSRLDILRMVKAWVVGHILEYDLALRRYLPPQGE